MPDVIVPTVAKEDAEVRPDKVVINGREVVAVYILSELRFAKFVLMTLLEFLSVSEPCIVVMVAPSILSPDKTSIGSIGIK